MRISVVVVDVVRRLGSLVQLCEGDVGSGKGDVRRRVQPAPRFSPWPLWELGRVFPNP